MSLEGISIDYTFRRFHRFFTKIEAINELMDFRFNKL